MIIVCKNCKATFLVPSNVFAKGAKTFRCAKCDHVWKEVPPAKASHHSTPQPFSPPPPPHIPPQPIPEQAQIEPPLVIQRPQEPSAPLDFARIRRLAIFAAAVASGLFFLFSLIFVAGHSLIIQKWPHLQPVYVMLGLAKDPLEDNLMLAGISSGRRYLNGAMHLVVEGTIVSHAKNRQVIPTIMAEAIGPDGRTIESWRIEPPQATIDPNTTIPFSSAIIPPKENAVEVSLSFTELPDDEH